MEALGDFRPSTAHTRELGDEVREVRERSGLSLTKLAEGLGWSPGKLSKLEHGRRGGDVVDLIRLVGYCQGDQASLDRILSIAREGETGYIIRPHLDGVPDALRALISSERRATTMFDYESMRVPGLLQTEDYARALMLAGSDPRFAVEPGVQTRMERQEVLHRSQPAHSTFFIHEAALHSWVGDWQVMADQMLHLALTSAAGHLHIRLVPFRGGSQVWTAFPFRLMEFKDSEPLVHSANLTFSVLSERPEVVKRHRAVTEAINAMALSEEESRSEFARWADHYERLRGDDDNAGGPVA
ncbi:helix-turn-helix domain-containing protein [Umezawaea tangerina]|uniref:Transcriptional regulator with XRE-family HTH domain n=1 Tax=Umezawaea tangerina TaxID=84725 RepID=A0A2T0SXX0_9PSEU|nr:helix-turn-helix transcriptional regulator [Umezawaea tangerina]PRY38264.1 transcriptional regulator with XRE-family HTH domain [Umezawaea tangerina]